MDNFNKEQILYCQYCGKECKSLNSLKQHEIRCKHNINAIKCNLYNKKGLHKGYKWMTYKNEEKFVNPNKFDFYLKLGWNFGMSKEHKEKSATFNKKNKPLGKCKDPQKELERKQKISNSMKGNKNWMFNKTRGNSKQGWYQGIYCDSSWELAFLVYYKEHNLNIKRCSQNLEYIWNNEKHIYTPDFEVDEGLIEIKGRKTEQSEEKHNQYPNIKVIDFNLIKPYLDYVINKYGNKFWKILYNNG